MGLGVFLVVLGGCNKELHVDLSSQCSKLKTDLKELYLWLSRLQAVLLKCF